MCAVAPERGSTAARAPGTPGEFLRWLHGDLRFKTYVVQKRERQSRDGSADEEWLQHCIDSEQLDYMLTCGASAWECADDTYVMLNETRTWRVSHFVNCLKAFVVDLDCHRPGDPPVPDVIEQAMAGLRAAGLPLPQLVVHTGRGAQLLWRLGRVGLKKGQTNAAKRWVLMQKALARAAGPHADTSLIDLVRIVRMPGTRNTKVPDPGWLTWSEFVADVPEFYSFDELCDRYLPVTREVCNAGRRRGKADGEASGDDKSSMPQKKRRALRFAPAANDDPRTAALAMTSHRRMQDYERIAEHFFMAGIPQGYRDQFLFCVAADLAWTTPLSQADGFERLVLDRLMMMGSVVDQRTVSAYHGRVNEPLSLSEARAAIGTVVRRFRNAAAGLRGQYDGKDCDPRYWLKTATVWERLGKALEAEEGLVETLQEVLPERLGRPDPASAQLHPESRKPDTRLRSNRYKNHHRTIEDRANAVAAVLEGSSQACVAQQFGVAARTLRSWLLKHRTGAASAGPPLDPRSSSAPTPAASEPPTQASEPGLEQATAPAAISPAHLYGEALSGAGSPLVAPSSTPASGAGGQDAGQGSAAATPSVRSPAALQGGGQVQDRLAGRPQDGALVHAPCANGPAGGQPHSPEVSSRRAAGGRRSKVRHIEEARLERLRTIPAHAVLQLLADHAKEDRDFRPTKNPLSARWHASVDGYDVELVCTGARFWDTRAGCGGCGAIDLAMHLFNLDFKRAVAFLRDRGIDGLRDTCRAAAGLDFVPGAPC